MTVKVMDDKMSVSRSISTSRVPGNLCLIAALVCVLGMAVSIAVRVVRYPSLDLNAVPLTSYLVLTVLAYLIPVSGLTVVGVLLRRRASRQRSSALITDL